LLLFTGMAGFLIAAIGIPNAFDGTGVIFGAGYLVVICVHLMTVLALVRGGSGGRCWSRTNVGVKRRFCRRVRTCL
jgi:hypothetical protein